jgi:DNA-directed RNA polymerase specialized sigma subunit
MNSQELSEEYFRYAVGGIILGKERQFENLDVKVQFARGAFATLNELEKEVVRRVYVEGQTDEVVRQQLGISASVLKATKLAAKAKFVGSS